MICNGCGNDKAWKTVSGDGWEYCNRCGDFKVDAVPDVFWNGSPEHGLADDERTGRPRVFSSKREKAEYLKSKGLVEGWAKQRFSRESDARVCVEKALQNVKNMGQDYRRSEFNRIRRQSEKCST
jgi:hypothetical protein